jgi:hypothetical protein
MSSLCFWANEKVTGLVSLIRKPGIAYKLWHTRQFYDCILCNRKRELGKVEWVELANGYHREDGFLGFLAFHSIA